MEQRRLQRIIAMLAVFAMLFSNSGIAAIAEGTPGAEDRETPLRCGLEEHQHSEECYGNILTCEKEETAAVTRITFRNTFQVHRHQDSCYDDADGLTCGYIEDKYYHTHNEFCRDEAGNLICGLQAVTPHIHTDECYKTELKLACGKEEDPGHKHSDACYKEKKELTCGTKEDAGHHHGDGCYKEYDELTCDKKEDPGHHHGDDCYTERDELTCGKKEDPGHHHGDDCYKERTELTCGEKEDPGHHHSDDCYKDKKKLACEQEEDENHTHTDECYTIVHKLICDEEERDGHKHDASCYTTIRDLVCKEKERDGHTHDASCYTSTRDLTCKEKERDGHTHNASCYTMKRELTCKEKERDGHRHSDVCYTTKQELTCKEKERKGHKHSDDCYETEEILICEEPTTTHHHTEECRDEEGILICGKLEIPEFTCTEDNRIEEVTEEGHKHSDECYEQRLICGKEEHIHTDACYPEAEEPGKVQNGEQTKEPGDEEPEEQSEGPWEDESDEETEEQTEDLTEEAGEQAGEESEEPTEEPADEEAGEQAGEESEEPTEEPADEEAGEQAGEESEELTEEPADEEAGEETGEESEEPAEEPTDEEENEEQPEEEDEEQDGEIIQIRTADDSPYAVTVSFGANAGIPEGTEIAVSEAPAEEEPQVPETAAEEAPDAEAAQETARSAGEGISGILLYQKALKIALVYEGEEITPDPEAEIRVEIRLPGIEAGQAVEVSRITENGPERLESLNDAGTITFTTNSFPTFEFTSEAQQICSWTTEQTENTFYGKTASQEAQATPITLTDVTEGLEILEAYTLTKSSDLWITIRRTADSVLGRLESIALYTVEDGTPGTLLKDQISLTDILQFNLGELSGYALVRDSGLRRRTEELGDITLDGMMPKNAAAEAANITEEYAEANDNEEIIAAYDISILQDGEAYQPEENPITVTVRNGRIDAALEEGRTVRLWHIPDEGEREEVLFTTEDGVISFEASAFSVYLFSTTIEKTLNFDSDAWKVTVTYGGDAGIPEEAELNVQEAAAEEYQDAAAAAWSWTEDNYIFYTKFLDISIVKDGETIEPLVPVYVSVQLTDVEAGAEALQTLRFDENGAQTVSSQAGTDGTVVFETDSFSVFGFGNALHPLAITETEEASLTILGFGGEAQLTTTEAPGMEEGLEVLGTFAPENSENSEAGNGGEENGDQTAEDGTGEEPAETTEENSNTDLWIKAELKAEAELSDMESVLLCAVDGEETDPMITEVTTDGQIVKLDAENIALIKDTGYRHLNFVLDPDGESRKPVEGTNRQTEDRNPEDAPEESGNGEEETEETGTGDEEGKPEGNTEENGTGDRMVLLDGMMPKDAEATALDVTEGFATHEYPAKEETEEDAETGRKEEPAENNPEEEQAEEDGGEEAANEDTETRRITLAAYEITILNNETEYQPDTERPIQVEIRDSRITADRNIELWHIRNDGIEERVGEFTVEEGMIGFAARGFSVYAIVDADFPEHQTEGEITEINEISDGQSYLLSLTRNGIHYITNNVLPENELEGNTQKSRGALYYFEKPEGAEEDSNQFYIYSKDGETKKYLYGYVQTGNNEGNLILSESDKTLFTVEKNTRAGATGKFYIYVSINNKNWALSIRGIGNIFLANRNNGINANEVVTITFVPIQEDDPYELDGKKYGLMRYVSGVSGRALTVNDSGNLASQEMLVKENPLNRKENLYVAKDSNISMWQFNTEGADLYTLSTDVNGSTKFLKINSNSISLVETEDAASRIQVIPGTGSNEGKVRLKDNSNNKTIYLNNNNTFAVANDSASAANQYMSFAVLSELGEDDFVPYSAQKVSIADQDQQVQNGDLIVIYTRRWNDTDKQYEFYVVDHNGDLVRAYEEGGSIQWVGTKINTAVWHFTEYYWEGTNEPNYYYDIKNDYTNQYLSPQVSGQIFSNDPVGINLNGRRYNDYYSTILAWDDPTYAYAGIKTNGEGNSIETCRIGKAEDFYFAKMEMQTTDTLTPVSTVDHTAYGITMKMVDFNYGTTNPQGTTTDPFQHEIMGDTNKYDANFDGTKNLLSTDLKSNGYPIATLTQRSLGELFAGASEVNHLFLDSTYYGSGYFSYDSAQNFASLQDNNDFIVYKEIGTDDSSSKPSLKHGNFFPYNVIEPGRFASVNPENLYTATQVELPEDYPRKHEKLYLVRNTDCYFGMEISASFVQTPNGRDAWNHDIIYEFVGDDDFWLYVDDELVVDLGGIHSALGAKVNFATGTVVVGGKNGHSTTLYEVFKANYKTRNDVGDDDPGLQAYLAERFTQKNGNWVFKDYSTHTMRIFYMERGGGASNLKMRFNLASVNPNQILLTKEVSGIADAEFLTTKFPYQIWFQPPHEDDYITMIQEAHDVHGYRVTYKNTNEEVEFHSSYTIGDKTYDNVFMLKPGQTVEINTPDQIGKYRIVECGIPGNIYNRYGDTGNYTYHAMVNDDVINGTIAGADAGYPLLDYATDDAKVTERAQVVFTNHVNEDYLRTLSITKKLLAEDGTTVLTEEEDPTGFRYRLYLGESLGYYNMGDYFVKSPDGAYCKYENGRFVSIGKSLFDDLTDDEKDHVTFTTSPAGSVDKIPTGYTVEIRDLPVGTKFMVEERTADLPEGYTLKRYERDPDSPYIYYDNVYNEGEIQEGNNARLFVVNQRGWGLTVHKAWTDKSFTRSHDPVYVAIYTGPEDSDLLPGSVRQIAHPSTSAYYYIDELIPGKTFEDYHVCEVVPVNPVTDDEGTVTGYDNISRVTEGVPVVIGATNLNGEAVSPVPKYLVTYDQGVAEGATDSIHNVRTDTITNQREGGVILRLYDWEKDWNTEEPNKPKMLSGGVFRLEKGGEPVGDGTFTSDSRGLITVLYDFETDTNYTLTQISAPAGYQGLKEPLIFTIPPAKDNITVTADSSVTGWYEAETIDQTSGDNLIAYINLKNKPFTLKTVKIDPDPNDPKVLAGAHFALYRQYTGQEGNPVKDYYPMPGFEDRISGLDDGVVDGIDQTLAPWTYYLTETEAPTNYDKHEEDILFTISELGYVSTVPEGYLTESEGQDGTTTEYTISIPNKKLVLIPPVLYVSKKVEGSDAQTTKPFRFTVSGLTPNKEYVYQRFETENGTDYHEQSGAAALGFIKVNAQGEISFDLMHYEKIGISLPYGSTNLTVSESIYPEYTASYTMDEGESVAGNSALIESFTEDVVIAYTNSTGEETIVAPTGYSSRRAPYFLLMAFGFALMAIIGGTGFIKRRKTAGGKNDPPDPGNPPGNNNGPPGGRKQSDTGGRTDRRSGVRITDKRSATSRSPAAGPIPPLICPTTRGAPPCPRTREIFPRDPGPLPPPCPRATLWARPQGPPGNGVIREDERKNSFFPSVLQVTKRLCTIQM